MADLIFRYGAMGSSKTANALMLRYNYEEKGQKAVLLKPATDSRDGDKTVKSRIGLQAECFIAEEYLRNGDEVFTGIDALIVDECQFLNPEDVQRLAYIADFYDIPVYCYGLRTDFRSHMFPGSARLFELADKIEQIPTVCWCGRRAHFNARVSDGKLVREGEQVLLGGNESYVALCRKHFYEGKLSAE
ncbi:MAG: thymidine kinase [Clostridia bacterium]|nr:thymidine kinase [Clostridia bacterium]